MTSQFCSVCGVEGTYANPLWRPSRGGGCSLCINCVKDGCRQRIAFSTGAVVAAAHEIEESHHPHHAGGLASSCEPSSSEDEEDGQSESLFGEVSLDDLREEAGVADPRVELPPAAAAATAAAAEVEAEAEEQLHRLEDVLLLEHAAQLRKDRARRTRCAEELLLEESGRQWRQTKRAAVAAASPGWAAAFDSGGSSGLGSAERPVWGQAAVGGMVAGEKAAQGSHHAGSADHDGLGASSLSPRSPFALEPHRRALQPDSLGSSPRQLAGGEAPQQPAGQVQVGAADLRPGPQL